MEWQLIETAPTDHDILIWDKEMKQCVVGSGRPGRWFVADTYGFCEDGWISGASHWRELPEGPDGN